MTVDPEPGSAQPASMLAAHADRERTIDVGYHRAAACQPPSAPALARINSLAVASLICGVAEFPTLGLSALPAVILGSKARQQIRQTGQAGEGLAVAGLILGWIALAVFFAAVVGIMVWLLLPPGPGAGGPVGS